MDQPRRMGAEVVKQGLRSHGCLTQGAESLQIEVVDQAGAAEAGGNEADQPRLRAFARTGQIGAQHLDESHHKSGVEQPALNHTLDATGRRSETAPPALHSLMLISYHIFTL